MTDPLGTWLREATELWPLAAELASLFPADTCEKLLPANAPQIQLAAKLINELRDHNRAFSAAAVSGMKPLFRGDQLAQRAKLQVPLSSPACSPNSHRAHIGYLAWLCMTLSSGSSQTSPLTPRKPNNGSTAI